MGESIILPAFPPPPPTSCRGGPDFSDYKGAFSWPHPFPFLYPPLEKLYGSWLRNLALEQIPWVLLSNSLPFSSFETLGTSLYLSTLVSSSHK